VSIGSIDLAVIGVDRLVSAGVGWLTRRYFGGEP